MITGALLLAAGSGTRFGSRKQDIIFHDKVLWRYAYDVLTSLIDREKIIVVGKDIPGGETRTESVNAGLMSLPQNLERVIIAEAARPFVTSQQIQILMNDTHDSVSFVKPLVNTVIYKNGDYINRSDLYDLLTPQAFNFKKLKQAYENRSSNNFTDDTRIMYEFHGIKPFFIETGQNLFKLTYKEDIAILESLYKILNF